MNNLPKRRGAGGAGPSAAASVASLKAGPENSHTIPTITLVDMQ